MKTRTITIVVGLSLLMLAAVTLLAAPWVAVVSAIAGASCASILRRVPVSDVTDLIRIVVLSGSSSIVLWELFASEPASKFGREHLAPMVEEIFFHFGSFVIGYAVLCFVIFMVILGSQSVRKT